MKGKIIVTLLSLTVASNLATAPHISSHGYANNSTPAITKQTHVVLSEVKMEKVTPTPTSTVTPPKAVELGDEEPSQQVMMQYADEQFSAIGANPTIINCIITHESRWNPGAVNPGYNNWDGIPDIGLMQIHAAGRTDVAQLYDWKYNIQVGIGKYLGGVKYWHNGYHPWSTRFECGVNIN